MLFWLSILAALGCAVCNGISAVLQKTGADSTPRANSLHPGLLWRLMHNIPYITGALVDLVAWALTLVAVHNLPLFMVQPITGMSVIVTVIIERLFFHKKLHPRTLVAIAVILIGLSVVASQATVQTARIPTGASYWIVLGVIPAVIVALGVGFVRTTASYATTVLAALSGIAFGGTAIAGRMLHFSSPYWRVVVSYPFASLLVYGILGVLLFTIALQRHHASTVSAATVASETIVPIIIGLILLGDTPRNSSYIVIILGAVVTIGGLLAVIAVERPDEVTLN